MRTPEKMSDPATESQALEEYSAPVTLSLPEPAPPVLPEGHTTPSDAEEIARLRRLVAEKGHTNLRFALAESELSLRLEEAKEINAELRSQLQTSHSAEPPAPAVVPDQTPKAAAGSADVAKLQAEWRRAMQSLEREHLQRKMELVLVRGQLHQTRRQLEQEYNARQKEAARYSANAAVFATELAEAVETSSHRSQWRIRITRALIAAIMVTAAVLTVALTIWTLWTRVSSGPCVAAQMEQIGVGGSIRASPRAGTQARQAPAPGVSGGMNRLNGALAAFPYRRPEEILGEVHRKAGRFDPSVCAFEWNNGQPSLVYGGPGQLTLAATIEKCAGEVEKYHQ